MQSVCDFLEQFAPLYLAADWDNVGLLVGDRNQSVSRIMTCLTVAPATVEEAIDERAELIVSHHPLPFYPVKRLTTDDTPGRLLWQLIGAGIAIYSPHTAFDSAAAGINQQLADAMGLQDVAPLEARQAEPDALGAGRWGTLPAPAPLGDLVQRVKQFLAVDGLHIVGDPQRRVCRVAVACGAAGSYLPAAIALGCDAMLLGETHYHTCLEAEASGVSLLLPGHYASERFALEVLARQLQDQFAALTVWASRKERDPLQWM
jgi:dinuclear metal center YbgI/SA1388 family protein